MCFEHENDDDDDDDDGGGGGGGDGDALCPYCLVYVVTHYVSTQRVEKLKPL